MVKRFWAFLLIAFCGAPLGACGNFVRSERPLFTAAHDVGVVPLRQGIWGGWEPGCAFDVNRPVKDWPSCAGGFVVGPNGPENADLKLLVDRVAAGDPMIVQLSEGPGAGYAYAAMEILARDKRGRATSIRAWAVLCNAHGVGGSSVPAEPAEAAPDVGEPAPTPPSSIAPPEPSPPPRDLFPGLVADGANCLATDPDTVRNAARMSKAGSGPVEIRWLRAGSR